MLLLFQANITWQPSRLISLSARPQFGSWQLKISASVADWWQAQAKRVMLVIIIIMWIKLKASKHFWSLQIFLFIFIFPFLRELKIIYFSFIPIEFFCRIHEFEPTCATLLNKNLILIEIIQTQETMNNIIPKYMMTWDAYIRKELWLTEFFMTKYVTHYVRK